MLEYGMKQEAFLLLFCVLIKFTSVQDGNESINSLTLEHVSYGFP